MKKMYEKNEIAFAIMSIVVYTASMSILRNLGDDSPWMMLGLIAYSAAIFLFVRTSGLMEKYGLSGWAKNSKAMLWFIPLWIIASSNLWAGVFVKFPMPGQIFAVISMALVGFAEELIFRGFLFKAMLKNGSVKSAVIVSSVTFGLGHILNLFTGHDLIPTLVQVVFAVAVGFILTMAFYKSGSLLPNILMHSLVDVFSLFAKTDAPQWINWLTHSVTVVLAIVYCLYLSKRVETPAINRIGLQQGSASGPRES